MCTQWARHNLSLPPSLPSSKIRSPVWGASLTWRTFLCSHWLQATPFRCRESMKALCCDALPLALGNVCWSLTTFLSDYMPDLWVCFKTFMENVVKNELIRGQHCGAASKEPLATLASIIGELLWIGCSAAPLLKQRLLKAEEMAQELTALMPTGWSSGLLASVWTSYDHWGYLGRWNTPSFTTTFSVTQTFKNILRSLFWCEIFLSVWKDFS